VGLVAEFDFGGAEFISENFVELTLSETRDDLRPDTGCEVGVGDIGRDPGIGVLVPEGRDDACFFCFFREDSLPEDSDKLGDPDLFRPFLFFFDASVCFGRPEGVLVPLEDAPDGTFDSTFSLFFASSSFRLSISFCFSSSEVSSSLCKNQYQRVNQSSNTTY
jgi:hypothetical protein